MAVVTDSVNPVERVHVATHVPTPAPPVSGTRVAGTEPEDGPRIPRLDSPARPAALGAKGGPETEFEFAEGVVGPAPRLTREPSTVAVRVGAAEGDAPPVAGPINGAETAEVLAGDVGPPEPSDPFGAPTMAGARTKPPRAMLATMRVHQAAARRPLMEMRPSRSRYKRGGVDPRDPPYSGRTPLVGAVNGSAGLARPGAQSAPSPRPTERGR